MPTPVPRPKRVLARRASNYRNVMRPTRWGNPFPLSDHTRERSLELYAEWLEARLRDDPSFLEPLRGFDLGCTCPAHERCHVDLLLARLYPERSELQLNASRSATRKR